ncbi:MAG TPA: diguanylate cyclase [Acetobacteraceae bacterium]|nr:diguanylate cyclase [Acetobacteraceae bacterium]
MEWLDHPTLRIAIDQELRKPWHGRGFCARLEERFQDSGAELNRRHNETAAIACLILFDAFGMTDLRTAPDVFHLSLVLRFLVLTPFVLLVLAIGRLWPNSHIHKGMSAAATVGATLIGAVLVNLSHSPGVTADCYSLPLALLFSNLLLRLGTVYSAITTIASMLIYLPLVGFAPEVPLQQIPVLALTEIAIGALSMLAVFHLEQRERQVFLLLLRERLQAEELSLENRELKTLSHTDALTGVSSRRHFDAALSAAWSEAAAQGRPLGLLMFDIDHFKLYNDRYGHPAGDACLRRVASIAQQQLRWGFDLLARYGGEEFAVILPGSDIEASAHIAERIRQGVEGLAIPHAETCPVRADAPVVSVSIGAASMLPGAGENPNQLLIAADTELYKAKQEGRNRVRLGRATRRSHQVSREGA